jgi:hypothetical protein
MLGIGCDGLALGGVDLDACRDPASGALAPWAEEVPARLATYAEVSPSGTGAKLFFAFDPSALPALRAAMGAAPGEAKNGRKWARSGADHGPAIELYLGGRFFAVTDERLPAAPIGLRKVPTETLLWLIREAGPRFKAADPDGACDGMGDADAGGDDPLMNRLYDAVGSDPALARRWAGDTAGLADGSRSGLAFALGAALKRAGFGFNEMRALLRRNPHTREWAAEKGEAGGGRELRRIWDRADAGTIAADPELLAAPDLGVLRLHRRAPPALPLDVFGRWWSGWVADAARGAACPPDYVAAPLLSSASALIGNARWAQRTEDGRRRGPAARAVPPAATLLSRARLPRRHCQLKAIRNEFRQLSCAEAAQSARLQVHSGAFTKDNCVGESVRGSS